MIKYLPKKIIKIDTKHINNFFYCNRKNTSFFFYNKKIHMVNNIYFKKHSYFQNWIYFSSRIYGFNNNIRNYFLSFIGCNINIKYTDLEEYHFLFLKSFLKLYTDYFSLSWYLLFLKERSSLLPLLYKGMRYSKKLPSRGQRTRSNYESSKKRKEKPSFIHFKKRLTNSYKEEHFPSWKKMETFYFHRF